ncbi:NADH:flavin oxidoreductase/NADH oxidase [Mycena rebaudengoi]|nr:NADH:flavin oxidoreductase/NADH oxidase [Mycena rebaudengoi]
MSTATAKLSQPVKLGELTLGNRVAMAPMMCTRAVKGVPLPIVREYYTQRASTLGTFIITEGKDNFFGMGRSATAPELADPNVDFDLVSVSAIPLPGQTITPRPLTVPEIHEYIQMFATAAENAVNKAGFDGVEIDPANRYFLDVFLQDTANIRTDEYGGSRESMSHPTAQLVGESKVGVRIRSWSSYQGTLMEDPIPAFSYLVQSLRDSFPNLGYLHIVEPRTEGPKSFIRTIWGPTRTLISAGGYNRESAIARAEKTGEIIAFARSFLANPDLPVRP